MSQVSDLGRDVHTARVVYRPTLDPSIIASGRFHASPHAAHFLTNADFPNGGLPDFGIGLGQLEVLLLHPPHNEPTTHSADVNSSV